MENIILIGMPGAGKSTVGVLLAKSLLMDFCDTDLLIQRHTSKALCETINEIGTQAFIALENEIVAAQDFKNCVVATGGSVVYGEDAMKNLRKNAKIVYLQVTAEELTKRIRNIRTRGIAMKEGTTIAQLYAQRAPLYEKYADITVACTARTPEECVDAVVKALQAE